MWYRSDRPVVPADLRRADGRCEEWLLCGPGLTDFTTYFNALSVSKLKRYASASKFFLHVEVCGAACEIIQTRADACSRRPQLLEHFARVEATPEWTSVDIELTADDAAVLIAFAVRSDDTVRMRNAYYSVEIPAEPQQVELAIATTTFKKESYVLANIDRIRNEILRASDEMSHHVHLHVIDNGKTLDPDALDCPGISIHPNPNVGGAGGFARGMIEAMRQDPPATHVLLMDDDIAISPESIRRTYNLLRMLNEEYREAFVSGAMLNLEDVDLLWEDLGYMTDYAACLPCKPAGLRMSSLPDILYSEQYELPPERDGQTAFMPRGGTVAFP